MTLIFGNCTNVSFKAYTEYTKNTNQLGQIGDGSFVGFGASTSRGFRYTLSSTLASNRASGFKMPIFQTLTNVKESSQRIEAQRSTNDNQSNLSWTILKKYTRMKNGGCFNLVSTNIPCKNFGCLGF